MTILAIDQGTTSSRAILFDAALRPIAQAGQEFPQIFPRPGWVEHDPAEIWASVAASVQGVLARAGKTAAEITAIGITNQRETTVIWERATGRPIHNALVWQDRRTAETCARLTAEGREGRVRAHRARARPLFLRHENRLDPRSCAGRAGACRGGRSGVWHG